MPGCFIEILNSFRGAHIYAFSVVDNQIHISPYSSAKLCEPTHTLFEFPELFYNLTIAPQDELGRASHSNQRSVNTQVGGRVYSHSKD